MDFIDGLPRSKGFTVILVVVDRLSKYAHFIPLKHPYTATTVAEAFMKEVVKLHGIPDSIVSDRDRVFLSHFWKELFKLQGTKLHRSTAYHPQSDGQTEVVNRTLETYLRCFAGEKPKEWVQWLPWAEFWYNTSFHSATQTTPFQVLYGREPPRLIPYEPHSSSVQQVDQLLIDRDQILKDLKEQLSRAQQVMKTRADNHRRDIQFKIGDYVYVKLRPYRQVSLAGRRNEKLSAKYFGPYQVLERIGPVAYRVNLPENTSIHPVFHVSQLREARGMPPSSSTQLPDSISRNQDILEPESMVKLRSGIGGTMEGLIVWKGRPAYDATWEPLQMISQQFPEFHLEDKVAVLAGSNDRNQELETDTFQNQIQRDAPAQDNSRNLPFQVYSRRTKGQVASGKDAPVEGKTI
ncbi:unnamed protein product [Rhodiola kirilowii]